MAYAIQNELPNAGPLHIDRSDNVLGLAHDIVGSTQLITERLNGIRERLRERGPEKTLQAAHSYEGGLVGTLHQTRDNINSIFSLINQLDDIVGEPIPSTTANYALARSAR